MSYFRFFFAIGQMKMKDEILLEFQAQLQISHRRKVRKELNLERDGTNPTSPTHFQTLSN